MVTVYLGIGSNLGDRGDFLAKAIQLLKENPRIWVTKVSSFYETDPVGGPPQGKFLNGALEIKTDFSPLELLNYLKDIERWLGRKTREKNCPREIDLDILLYGNEKIHEKDLEIPHPRMFERDFVRIPLLQIAAHLRI